MRDMKEKCIKAIHFFGFAIMAIFFSTTYAMLGYASIHQIGLSEVFTTDFYISSIFVAMIVIANLSENFSESMRNILMAISIILMASGNLLFEAQSIYFFRVGGIIYISLLFIFFNIDKLKSINLHTKNKHHIMIG